MDWREKLTSFLRRGARFDKAVRLATVAEPSVLKNDLLNLRRTEKNRIKKAVQAGCSLKQAFQESKNRYAANIFNGYFR